MQFTRLQQLASGLLFVASLGTLSGCTSMGSGMANSSGMSYYESGNYAAAASEFQTALMSDPQNPDYMANYAKARMKMGDAQGAEQMFRQALTVSPSHQPSYHGLAELMLAQGRGNEAQAMMTTWVNSQPYVAESHVEMAWLQREMGNTPGAAESLQRALQVNPSNSVALAHLGQYYEEMGQPSQAVAMYQQSLRADWNQPEVHSRLAAASQTAGPSSAMAATAMARGVHPYSMARQPNVFGAPSAGSQMAQMQIAQQQMAMSGSPMMMSPMMAGNTAPQMAMTPSNAKNMTAFYPNSGWRPSGNPSPMMMNPGQTSGVTFSQPTMLPPEFLNTPGTITFGPETPLQIPSSSPATNTATAPVPDPAFSATKPTPATTVSLSATVDAKTAAGAEPPIVDAF
ncbi:MAG: tetratricopeptide repeat protein [Planctomycetaceae bacterium]|nr:tetratricopeptide repeat protein [Planctomycetaceae bacterium]